MTPTEYATAIGSEVRAELARQRKTQADLAAALSLTPATIGRRLDGTSPFNVVELAKTANWLGVPVANLRPATPAVSA
ncbi:helix-turn-helix transcriptional regulator [Nocardioides sp.]|uniref:helix-turn-helix domain-containing protein n=1 Tax=Nocardioides sp. TaxID=35761 RepID=UPI002CFF7CBF|nr:helix-turn-helix transcriptional regulator [Nocardioides sp.]HXH77281.1 helix-turn-helix transcriptional regulator [Nocardioides sp.]